MLKVPSSTNVDANAACTHLTSRPVENVIWPSSAPDGTYTVIVSFYDNCGNPTPQHFSLSALVDGQPVALRPAATGVLAQPGQVAIIPALATQRPPVLVAATSSQSQSNVFGS